MSDYINGSFDLRYAEVLNNNGIAFCPAMSIFILRYLQYAGKRYFKKNAGDFCIPGIFR
jgi:hypothetical protein